jgi:tRNA A-37 threonylcarbamoyl transferase component Bud32
MGNEKKKKHIEKRRGAAWERVTGDSFLPYGFVKKSVGGNTLYLRRDVVDTPEVLEILIEPFTTLQKKSDTRPLTGRGTVLRLPVTMTGEKRGLVLREYLHGGLFRAILKNRFLIPHRALRELFALTTARRRGVPVPEAIGAVKNHGPLCFFYRARIVTIEIPHSQNLPHFLCSVTKKEKRRDLLLTAGGAIRTMHDAGMYHRDLNLNNLLVKQGKNEITLLDFDRAVIADTIGMRRRKRNLKRLYRSFKKIGLKMPIGTDDDFEDILSGYAQGDGILLDALKRATIHSRALMIRARTGWFFEGIYSKRTRGK